MRGREPVSSFQAEEVTPAEALRWGGTVTAAREEVREVSRPFRALCGPLFFIERDEKTLENH